MNRVVKIILHLSGNAIQFTNECNIIYETEINYLPNKLKIHLFWQLFYISWQIYPKSKKNCRNVAASELEISMELYIRIQSDLQDQDFLDPDTSPDWA